MPPTSTVAPVPRDRVAGSRRRGAGSTRSSVAVALRRASSGCTWMTAASPVWSGEHRARRGDARHVGQRAAELVQRLRRRRASCREHERAVETGAEALGQQVVGAPASSSVSAWLPASEKPSRSEKNGSASTTSTPRPASAAVQGRRCTTRLQRNHDALARARSRLPVQARDAEPVDVAPDEPRAAPARA